MWNEQPYALPNAMFAIQFWIPERSPPLEMCSKMAADLLFVEIIT